MVLSVQRRLAAAVMRCSPKRVWMDSEHLGEIKECITKADIRGLINKGLIQETPTHGISRGRIREARAQRRKGRRSGHGSRKGSHYARVSRKQTWIYAVRIQREFLKRLRDTKKISRQDYRLLYRKAKGGFFRSKRHVQLHITEHNLWKGSKRT
ncbi:50S ribosomal protein L19e [Candidatus Woesearchaeota archaeon]|nr:50S ribosomal protein L19e [Candidatus Woesearchaeota archaeon]